MSWLLLLAAEDPPALVLTTGQLIGALGGGATLLGSGILKLFLYLTKQIADERSARVEDAKELAKVHLADRQELAKEHTSERVSWHQERVALAEARSEERKTWVEILAEERRDRAEREAAMREEERNNLRSLQESLRRGPGA